MRAKKIRILGLVLILATTVHAQRVIQRCDITSGWKSNNSLSVDVTDYKEGRASLKSTGASTVWFSKLFSQTHSGIDENGYLSLWLYIADLNLLDGDGQIEISSSGNPDQDEYAWNISELGLVQGWNELNLSIMSATKTGNPDLGAVRFFRIYHPLSGSAEIKLDYIRFRDSLTDHNPDVLEIAPVDPSTLDGKVMFGYQGWFTAKGDGWKLDRFHHWGDLSTGSGDPKDLSVEMWFDDDELDPDELYKTGYYYPDGREARAFSSYNKKTVVRHMKWLRDYDLDGVFLQRFMSEARDEAFKELRDSVASHVKDGCERYGRTFAMMWDGVNYAGASEDIKADWKHLVDDLKLTESPNYLHHRGLPLISLWGYSVRAEADIEELKDLIDFFHNNPEEKYRASIKLGCNDNWRTKDNGAWAEVFKQVEVISPWTVGRYGSSKSSYENYADNNTIPDQVWCDENNVDFMPVNWPGFSWYNLHDGPKNQHPRRGGDFFWEQASGNLTRGAKSLYIAMFDEIDEATAFFKMPETANDSPDKGYWISLNIDGLSLPSDWYLRCVKLATQVTRGWKDNPVTLGVPDDGIDVYGVEAQHATCEQSNGALILSYPNTTGSGLMQYSIDGGQNYNYTTPSDSEQMSIPNLSPGLYDIWIREQDGSNPTDLGDKLIVNTTPQVNVEIFNASCNDDGIIDFRLSTNPYIGAVDISLDGGVTYDILMEEGTYSLSVSGLSDGVYDIWARWSGTSCSSAVGNFEIVRDIPEPIVSTFVYGAEAPSVICQGSELTATVSVDKEVSSWTWTGPKGFEASTSDVLIADSLTSEHAGTYSVSYLDTNGCSNSSEIIVEVSSSAVPDSDFLVEASGKLLDPETVIFCKGDRLILEGTPNEEGLNFVWEGPNGFNKEGRRATLTASANDNHAGVYTLTVSSGDDCFVILNQEILVGSEGECGEQVLAADDQLWTGFLLYPNPATRKVHLEHGGMESGRLTVTDLTGKKHLDFELSQGNSLIDVSELLPGLYLFIVEDVHGQTQVQQLLKN
ncbi:T9SS type A sorting domain-containing protein [Reichenbachiella ulvae]|uniref:T9SS type A sorting domain-containing protein n=1 Tax=Reichenbachiella ulvae TaxID=2980104 RepID=A0ABT3CNE0_9BACT|nr:T9SS type A sorting domain-containing protein [Reichenbachiella ulvae]MCV9385256.1 T9SS type A sorting domain-containing protein [Reichenbachiella ulvae]